MNDKDKEAFEKWWMEGFKGMPEKVVIKYKDVGKQASLLGWINACEYKQIEIDELKTKLSVCKNDYWFMINLIERYSTDKEQALKDCLERMKFRKGLFNILGALE